MFFRRLFVKISDFITISNIGNSNYKNIQKGNGNIQNFNNITKNGYELTYAERRIAAEELLKVVKQYCFFLLNPDSQKEIPEILKKRVKTTIESYLFKLHEEDQKRFFKLITPLFLFKKSDLEQKKDLIKKEQEEINSLLNTYIE